MDFNLSERAQDYLGRVKSFMEKEILPIEDAYFKELAPTDPELFQTRDPALQ